MRFRIVELSVGAFVLLGFVAMAFLALQVSGLNPKAQNKTYKIYAEFTNVAGLTARAKVMVAGVLIGRVSEITIDREDFRARVEMNINQDIDFLTSDSIAAIQTAGVLGEKYIGISLGGDTDVLKEGDEIVDTQSAFVLEELIGQIAASFLNKK
jgi:phospholipid/cholesterol/gamma-HCH transport system substrate-binding protein